MANASKNKKRPSSGHIKRHGLHQKRTQHFLKTYWPYLPMATIVGIALAVNVLWSSSPPKQAVLGEATDVSMAELLTDTNTQRTLNGETPLTVNTLLDNAAQAKANDMVTKNYWAHTSPSGETPWEFITGAGYSYRAAGENLAYGFDTSQDTVTAWMNSPEHRANILDLAYKNVGFGIANSENFQNSGPQTIIVAEYAEPLNAPAPAPIVATKPTPPPSRSTVAASQPAAAPVASATPAINHTPAVQAAPKPSAMATNLPSNITNASKAKTTASIEPPSTKVARIQIIGTSVTKLSTTLLTSITIIVFGLFIYSHSKQLKKVLGRGEKFVFSHVMVDLILITIVMIGYSLTRTAGIIR